MTKTPVPDEVRRFILTSIPSVPYLEALLLLRSQPSGTWEPAVVARRLYVADAHALALLQALAQAGFAVDAGGERYRFVPGPGEASRELIDRLAQTYSANLLAVTELIHSHIDKRALQFADAFRWTKKEN